MGVCAVKLWRWQTWTWRQWEHRRLRSRWRSVRGGRAWRGRWRWGWGQPQWGRGPGQSWLGEWGGAPGPGPGERRLSVEKAVRHRERGEIVDSGHSGVLSLYNSFKLLVEVVIRLALSSFYCKMTTVRKRKRLVKCYWLRYFADLELHAAESDVEEATEGLRGAGHTLYDQ